jgi:hypothetical protein
MKKIILSVLVLASLSTKAQMFRNSSDTAIIGNDTIYYQKGGILIKPVVVNFKGDSAWSLNWIANNLSSNGEGCNTYVSLKNKNNQELASFNCYIPASVVAVWGVSNTPIDSTILSQYPRFVKQD